MFMYMYHLEGEFLHSLEEDNKILFYSILFYSMLGRGVKCKTPEVAESNGNSSSNDLTKCPSSSKT